MPALLPDTIKAAIKEVSFGLERSALSESYSHQPCQDPGWKAPLCTQEVKAFLSLVRYYRKFCSDFATLARPLNILSSKGVWFL